MGRIFLMALLCGLLMLPCGCEDSKAKNGSNATAGQDTNAAEEDNQTNEETAAEPVLVAMGDSVTAGTEIPGPSYPEILSGLLGREVVNEGRGGVSSSDGAGRIERVLDTYAPSHVLIMYGINDLYRGDDYDAIIGNLRVMVRATKNRDAVPVLATIPPRFLEDGSLSVRHQQLNQRIRGLASSEGVPLADVESEFGNAPALMLPDGFHPNVDGNRVVAMTFYDAIR